MATEPSSLDSLRAQLAALEAASASNVQSVRWEDQQVTYRSAADMIEQMEYLRRRIAQLENAAANRTRYSVARFTCR